MCFCLNYQCIWRSQFSFLALSSWSLVTISFKNRLSAKQTIKFELNWHMHYFPWPLSNIFLALSGGYRKSSFKTLLNFLLIWWQALFRQDIDMTQLFYVDLLIYVSNWMNQSFLGNNILENLIVLYDVWQIHIQVFSCYSFQGNLWI